MTTVSPAALALAAACSCTIPSCIHTAPAPMAIASSTMAGTSYARRKISTISTRPETKRRSG